MAVSRGKVAKSAEARNPDTAECYNGWVTVLEGLLNGGSLYPGPCLKKQKRTKQKQANPDILLLLSMILMEQEKYAEAIDYLQAIKRQGESYEVTSLWYIGLCRLALEQYDQAEALFKFLLRKSGDAKFGKMSKGILKVFKEYLSP